jgi:two-component system cell cycle response regulator
MSDDVLIVSDSPEVLDKISTVVDACGFDAVKARSPADAAMIIRAKEPHVIVYDATSQKLSMREAVATVTLALPAWQVPVIALTEDTVTIRDLPDYFKVFDIVPHPFAPSEVSARLKAAMRTKRFQDQLQEAALVDPATSLLNRPAGEQRLKEEISRSIRYGRSLALLLAKIVGDPLEPEVEEIGRISRRHTRLSDAICRYDFDTLLFALPETGPFGAARVAQNLLRLFESNMDSILALAKDLREPDDQPQLDVNFGAAGFVESDTPESLLERVSQALDLAIQDENSKIAIARRDPSGAVRFVFV